MTGKADLVQINWTVWENNPTVSWTWDGLPVNVPLKLPPIAVVNLIGRHLIGIVGDFDELGSANLLFYSYDGRLRKKVSAPALGPDAQFGGVSENEGEIRIVVGFYAGTEWKEQAGRLNLDDGTIADLHRSY